MLKAIDTEQKVYVLDAGNEGYSCLGFDVAYERATSYANWLLYHQTAAIVPNPKHIGTERGYREYEDNLNFVLEYCRNNRVRCDAELKSKNPKITNALKQAYDSGKTVRIWCGDTETGRAWAEEFDVVGRVSKSTGTIPIYILVPKGDNGGSGILIDSIVKIEFYPSKTVLYQHPKFNTGQWSVKDNSDMQGYAANRANYGAKTIQK